MSRMLDHVVLCVSDLACARRTYERLGFTLTPPADHPFGTRNCIAQLEGNYIELLAVANPSQIIPHTPGYFSFAASNQAYLSAREGMSMLALKSDDAYVDRSGFAARGLDTYEMLEFGRNATLPNGKEARLSFSLAFATNPNLPDATFLVCQHHHAPELFWRPQYQRHRNGSARLIEVIMSATEPASLQAFFDALSMGEMALQENALHVGPAGDRITVLPPSQLIQRYPELGSSEMTGTPRFQAYRIRVPHREVIREILAQQGIEYSERENSVVIPPSQAHGVVIEFFEDP